MQDPDPKCRHFGIFLAFYGILAFLPISLIRNQIRFYPIFRLFPTFRLYDFTTLIPTDAVTWTQPSLPLDSKDLKLPLRYHFLFLDMTFQQTFPYITPRCDRFCLYPKSILKSSPGWLASLHIACTQFDQAFYLRLVPKFLCCYC